MSDKIVNHFVLADGSTAKYDAGALLNLDDTVSLAGYAPDAKAVGDRLTATEDTADHADELATTALAMGESGFNVFCDETQNLTNLKTELPYRANGYGSIKLHKITGKNLIISTAQTQTINGVTFTVNNDGTITANGTATGNITYFVANVAPLNKGDTYILTGCPSGGGATTYEMCMAGVYAHDYGTGAIHKPLSNMTFDIRIMIHSGVAINKTFSPMLRNVYKPIEKYGKNILDFTFKKVTTNGLTFTEDLDGTVTVNGTATASTSFYLLTNYTFEAGKTYKLTGCPSGGNMSTYRLAIGGVLAVDLGSGVVYKPETTIASSDVRILILSGTVCSNLVFKPVLIEESEPPYTYEKTEVTDYTLGFPATIYGGTVDFTNGVITSKYASNGTELATPTTHTITAPEIVIDTFATFYTDPQAYMELSYIPSEDGANNELYKNYEKTVVTSSLSVGLPILRLFGDTSLMTKAQKVSLEWIYESAHGTCTCKWQGASSVAYEKKNYSISLSKAFDFGWGEHKKYNLKANYIDFSSSRNVCSAKLWGDVVRSRTTVPSQLENLPNGGATDGFPVIVELNGEYHGLYTLTIPKEPYMLGIDEDSPAQAIVSAEDHSEPTKFKATITVADLVAETSFSVEYAPDEDNIAWIATSISSAITSAMNCSSAEDIETLAQHMDIDSVIDHYIFSVLIGGTDLTDKNYLLVTYGNDYWYMSEWDLDTTFGNHWTGGSYNGFTAYPTFASYANESRLMYDIYHYAKDRLKARYAELRNGALSLNSVTLKFYNFAVNIPSEVKDLDKIKHPLLPGTTTNDLAQVTNWYRQRLEACDAEIDEL